MKPFEAETLKPLNALDVKNLNPQPETVWKKAYNPGFEHVPVGILRAACGSLEEPRS